MATEFFQYQVNKLWYRLYWAFMVLYNLLIFSAFIAAQFLTNFQHYADVFSIGHAAFYSSAINLFYLLILFWIFIRYSVPFAMLIGSLLLLMSIMHGLSGTNQDITTLPYIIAWLISTFFIGLYGLPLLIGSIFITLMYTASRSNFLFNNVMATGVFLLLGQLLASAISYFFWRNKFVNVQEQRVDQLSGLLVNKQQQADVLIQSIADGVIVTNTEGKITLINPAAATMTEWSIEDASGVDASLVAKFTKEDGSELTEDDNPFAIVIEQKKHFSQTLQLVGREGKKQVVSLIISPVSMPGTDTLTGSVAVIRDISEEHAAEHQRADFISTASHEMRTPVAAIEGYLALALNEKVSTIDSRARGYLEKAHISTEHLGKLFQDLLTSSKAEDGRLSNHPQVVEMGAFLQQLTDDLKFAAEKKGLFVEFLIGASNDAIDATNKSTVNAHVLKPLYYTLADPERMREVITNLFDNACKYTEQGKISIGLTGDGDVVQMYVKDTGSGIPADDVPHLFQKFYRVDNSATRTIGGTGLGLFICRKIVELYKGRIWVESELGKGSSFFINLPRLDTQRAQQLQTAETGTATPVTAASGMTPKA